MRPIGLSSLIFLALGACAGSPAAGNPGHPENPENPGDPARVEIDIGECEGSGLRSSTEDSGTEELPAASMWAEGVESRIAVHLDDTRANCCPSPSATFTTAGDVVTLDFVDVTFGDPCDCLCVIDFVVTSETIAPGDYTLEAFVNGEALEPVDVTVP